ncbi:hypothetical protein ID866_10207 [Astraeus odoratus]|nr:hypothetical protein ID866_10207 [Astraeus odoratus]
MSVSIATSSFSFTMPCCKADMNFEGDCVLLQQLHADDPFSLFCMYLLSCDALFPLHPFLWVKVDGGIPTHSWFMSHFHHLFPHQSLGGHSLHVGGATSLTLSGVQPTQIQAIGQWSSSAWQRYVHKNPVLLQSLLFGGCLAHGSPYASLS